MKKRILALLLALCMVAGMLPLTVLAEDPETEAKPSIRLNYVIPGTSTYVEMNAGDAPIYWQTINAESTNRWYMSKISAETAAEEGWNAKLEYPEDGIPTMTLKNATLCDERNLTFVGSGANTGDTAYNGDVKIILEGKNYSSTNNAYNPDLYFGITGTATITGTGSLKIEHAQNTYESGIIHSIGNLVLDNVDVDIDIPSVYGRSCCGLVSVNGDITIKGGSLTIDGVNPYLTSDTPETGAWYSYRPMNAALKAQNGNVIIQDRADIKIVASPSNSGSKGLISTKRVTIKNSDVEVAAPRGTYLGAFDAEFGTELAVEYDGDYTITSAAGGGAYDFDTKTHTAPANVTTIDDVANYTITEEKYFKIKHDCILGETTYENATAECSEYKYEVTSCTICGETYRTPVKLENQPEKIHTPGNVVVKSQTSGYPDWSNRTYTMGTRVIETTCAVCGQVTTETIEYIPAFFGFSTGDAGISDTGKLTLQLGKSAYYNTVAITDSTNTKMVATEDTENWNVKLEYGEDGVVVITLKNANINNLGALYLGTNGFACNLPVKVVVEGTNYITTPYGYSANLGFNTTETATITGTGTLNLVSDQYGASAGVIWQKNGGDLILDGANINIAFVNNWGRISGITALGGDIIIKGGTLNIDGYSATGYDTIAGALYATKDAEGNGGNAFILDGAVVNIVGTPDNAAAELNGLIHLAGDMHISESTVKMGKAGYGYGALFSTVVANRGEELAGLAPKVYLDFAGGYTAGTSASEAVYDAEAKTFTAPADLATTSDISAVDFAPLCYFEVAPTKTMATFLGVRMNMENNLELQFGIGKVTTPDGYVKFARNGVEEEGTVSLSKFDVGSAYFIAYPGIAAKEMKDQISVTVYAADGTQVSVTKTDSVYDYAMRTLRSPKNAEDAAFKTLLVDLLNYGTMAQVQFDHNLSDLANNGLTPTEWTSTSQLGTYKDDNATASDASQLLGVRYDLNNSIAMQVGIRATAGVSYAMVYVGDSIEGTRIEGQLTGGYYTYIYEGMAPADARTNITLKFYKAGEDAATAEPTLTIVDSMECYVGRNMAKYPYLGNLIKYCDSAAAYLASRA